MTGTARLHVLAAESLPQTNVEDFSTDLSFQFIVALETIIDILTNTV